MKIDLHTHSYFSDGEFSPEAIILEAKRQNISTLSITDHNTIKYNQDLHKFAGEHNIKLIEGIEISTLHQLPNNSISLHVLGYGKNLNKQLLKQALFETIEGYDKRAQKIIIKLNKEFLDIKLDFEKIKKHTKEMYISRNRLARLLTKHTKTISINEALKKHVFTPEDNSWMIKTEESFRIINKAGGVPVLAHSGRELKKMGLENYKKMIAQFSRYNLKGLEVYYPKHTLKETEVIKDIAKRYGLHITGGSDWHGPSYTPDISMGINTSEFDINSLLNGLTDN